MLFASQCFNICSLDCKPISRALPGNFSRHTRSDAGWMQVLGGIVYGGRITDAADMHVLVALLRRFLRPELMDDRFSFASGSPYSRPPVGSLQAYRYLAIHCSVMQESAASLPIRIPQVYVHQNGSCLRNLVVLSTLGCSM